MGFAENLLELKKQYRVSQNELAEIAGVTQTQISNYINKINFPGAKISQKIADHFKVNHSWLIGLSDKKLNVDPVKEVQKEVNELKLEFMDYMSNNDLMAAQICFDKLSKITIHQAKNLAESLIENDTLYHEIRSIRSTKFSVKPKE